MSDVYFECNDQTGDHLKICKLFQSMNLRDINIDLDNYTHYCGLMNTYFNIECLNNDNNTIIGITLGGMNFENTNYQFNFSDDLGLPTSLTYIDFYRLSPVGIFDFNYIYSLSNLEILRFTGYPTRIKLAGTINWEMISKMPKLKDFYIQYRRFDGDIGLIQSFSGPLERIDVCRYIIIM